MNRQIRILIVEDEVIVAMAMQMELGAAGYDVCGIAATAGKAMDLFREHRPDIVLMDVNLSGGDDGIDLAQTLRLAGRVPVVFLTGYADSEVLARIENIPHSTHLVKPADIDRIEAAIRDLVAG